LANFDNFLQATSRKNLT